MATPFRVDLITPERTLFGGDADEVSMRTEEGEITFLAHHEDFIGRADVTVVRIHAVGGTDGEGNEVRAAIHGGIVHVDHDGLAILAGTAELAADIDVERARRALSAAEARLVEEQESRHEVLDAEHDKRARVVEESAEESVRRARARLDAAGADAAA